MESLSAHVLASVQPLSQVRSSFRQLPISQTQLKGLENVNFAAKKEEEEEEEGKSLLWIFKSEGTSIISAPKYNTAPKACY